MPGRNLIVIGCSGGGLQALKVLVSSLAVDLPASVLIVQHMLPDTESFLPDILTREGSLPAKAIRDGEIFEPAYLYLAEPDHHLVVQGQRLKLTHTAREKRSRPSIDALFRSAAAEHGRRVIGVILTGNLDDGAAGLKAVKNGGGITIVQNPNDAEYSGMPESAIRDSIPDYIEPVVNIGALLNRLSGTDTAQSATALKPTAEAPESA
jgi:two-component system chemotaxis response regulator CheB